MKKFSFLFTYSHFISMAGLTIAGFLVISSCRKRIPIPFEICRIGTVTIAGDHDTTVFHLSYDRQGRVTGIQSGSGANASIKTFLYHDTTELMTTTAGGNTSTDTVTLNSTGLMLVDASRSGSDYSVTDYYYNGTEVIQAILHPDGGIPGPTDYTSYTWQGDNLGIYDQGNTSTSSSAYSYNSSAAAVGDYFYIQQLLFAPAPTIRSANQVIEIQVAVLTTNITYTHDIAGRITGFTMLQPAIDGFPADSASYSYQYNCDLPVPLIK